jgi:glyoxylase-like metal-dependent hydrolase (beta-lactamase superfamily II)
MLLRSSALIYPGIHLITLGATCRYVISTDSNALVLSNPGASAHIPYLEKRFESLSLSLKNVQRVVLTSLDAAKVGGIALLRRQLPKLKVLAPTTLHAALSDEGLIRDLWERDQLLSSSFHVDKAPSFSEFKDALRIDKHLSDAETIDLGDEMLLRCVYTPGYKTHSATYIVVPHEFLITDETFGYYRGRSLAAPGANTQIAAAATSLAAFEHMELSGIGFPYIGAITGTLVRKHIDSVCQNTTDIVQQVAEGRQDGVSVEEIREQLKEAFFSSNIQDVFLQAALAESFESIWAQVSAASQ